MKEFPVGVAQQKVLDALGEKASDWGQAERIFDEYGITVKAKRVGHVSVPVVTIKPRFGGGFNQDGEGETWDYGAFPESVRTKLEQWLEVTQ